MNLKRLFEVQKELNDRIVKDKGLEGQDLFPNMKLALLVELGELANEWRGFKHWSDNREPRVCVMVVCRECHGSGTPLGIPDESGVDCWRCGGIGKYYDNPLLEEYVDCLHFLLSMGLYLGYDDYELGDVYEQLDTFQSFHEMFGWCVEFTRENPEFWEAAIYRFYDLGKRLGFEWDEVEAAYMKKNKINYERLKGGY